MTPNSQPAADQPADGEGGVAGEDGAQEEPEVVVFEYAPPEPKEWVSLGSEVEIEEAAVKETEQKVN